MDSPASKILPGDVERYEKFVEPKIERDLLPIIRLKSLGMWRSVREEMAALCISAEGAQRTFQR